eukprot:15613628-Heterocapsa_arctica.AAC.1
MRAEESGRETRQGGGHWRRMWGKDLHYMPGKGQHQRLQERQIRDRQQPYTGAMEHDEGEHTVQELDHPGEDRQDVRDL